MEKQTREILERPFEPHEIKYRDGSYGRKLRYLEGHTVIRRLAEATAGDWDFTVVSHSINAEADEIIVHSRMRIQGVIKEAFGSAKIKRKREDGSIIDIGNDYKSALTDSLKKAGSLAGIGLSLYLDVEDVNGGVTQENNRTQPRPHQLQQSGSSPLQHPQYRTTPTDINQSYVPPQSPSSAPEQRSGSTGRLSQKQHSYLLKLASAQGMSKRELSNYCQQRYGVVIDFLSRQDASALINQLRQGGIPAYNGDAA